MTNLKEDMSFKEIAEEMAEYCPYCARKIKPSNVEDVFNGDADGFVFVHDENVEHDEDFDFKPFH